MAEPKFPTPAARDRHLLEVQEMYLTGLPQHVIAERTGISPQQVSQDLKGLRRLWVESNLSGFDEKQELELKRIDRLEREYWSAWFNSLTPKQTTSTERGAHSTRAKVIKEERSGDARFLEGVRWCIEMRCRIFGIEAPKRIAVAGDFVFRVVEDAVETKLIELPQVKMIEQSSDDVDDQTPIT